MYLLFFSKTTPSFKITPLIVISSSISRVDVIDGLRLKPVEILVDRVVVVIE